MDVKVCTVDSGHEQLTHQLVHTSPVPAPEAATGIWVPKVRKNQDQEPANEMA